MRKLLITSLVAVAPLCAQKQLSPPIAPSYTVATLPGSPVSGMELTITDGASASGCGVGGGAYIVKCRWNGSSWVAISGSGGGAVSSVTAGATGGLDCSPTTGSVVCDIDPDYFSAILPSSKVWHPAVGCAGTTDSLLWDSLASNVPTATCSAGSTETTMMRGTADWPDSDGDYSLQIPIWIPADFTGAIDAYIVYRTTATSGNTVWQIATQFIGIGEVDDATYNTASTVTDAANGTANQLNAAAIIGVTITNSGPQKLGHFKILRNRTHASDTITGVVSLVGVELTIRRAIL